MSLILTVSIVIRLLAMTWSIVLLRHIRDWRMAFLTVMLGLMAIRQALTLLTEKESWAISVAGPATELPGLAVSVMAFFAVYWLERIITERKQAEEELQKRRDENTRLGVIADEQKKLQEWLDTFDTFVGKFDPNGVMIFCNEVPIKAAGVTKGDVFGKYFPDTKWWSHSEIERARIVECVERARAGLSSRIETNFRNADDNPVPIIFNCQPVMDDDGTVKYITAEGKTIIEETRLRTELLEAKEGLEIRVKERTSELVEANEKLRKEIAERKRMEGELKARARQQEAVAELGQHALVGTELSTLMDETVALVAQTLAVEYCKVLELLPDGNALLLRAGVGWKEGYVRHATVPAKNDSQAGYTLICSGPVIVEDLREETRFSGPQLLFDHGVVSGMSVIIPGRSAPFGVLGAHTAKRRSFTKDDAHFLQAIANVLATGIERKRAEEAIQESEERYRSLTDDVLDSSAVGIFILDCDFKVVWVNQPLERYFGLRREDILGKDKRQVIRERIKQIFEDPDGFTKKVLATYDNNTYIENFECHVLFAGERQERWLEHRSQPIRSGLYAGGRIEHYYDITERKGAEKEISMLAHAVKSIAECVNITDMQDKIFFVNEAFLKTYGYEEHELIGKPISIVRSENNPPELAKEVLGATLQGGWQGELLNRRKDGSDFPVFLSTSIVRDEKAQPVALIGVGSDITERKRVEEQIQEQAALIDIATDAILVRDLEDHILFWNVGATHLYGWPPQESIGKKVTELLYRITPPRFQEAKKILLEQGEWQGELQQVTMDGNDIVVVSRWTLMRDAEGKPKSVLVVNTDITEKKKLEGQFLRMQRMESIGTLAGGVAHDLNNILAPILMSAQMLKRKLPDEQSQQVLATVESSAERGADIVKQVLTFARGVEGERVVLQVKHLIRDIEKIVK
ncbi:MAG: PAS domain S-box protein, partial [Bacteroidota bacterium]